MLEIISPEISVIPVCLEFEEKVHIFLYTGENRLFCRAIVEVVPRAGQAKVLVGELPHREIFS